MFCRVVDNYGDAAVCWRLASQLAARGGSKVRLWIDDLRVLNQLRPEIEPSCSRQELERLDVRQWSAEAQFGEPADIVVDGFGCGLAPAYARAMATRRPPALWIVLEYLSAEPWVADRHGLPSPHPSLPLRRYFFFPGFAPGTGGLLREAAFDAKRSDFLSNAARIERFWAGLGFPPPDGGAIPVSLFGYANPAAAALMRAWSRSAAPVVAALPCGPLWDAARELFGAAQMRPGAALRRGGLQVRLLPFLAQERYDELLWACGWNFVRGEDSFVRAQWAERPLVWNIYPQEQRAHWTKLDAFLRLYESGLDPSLREPLRSLWRGWNEASRYEPGSMEEAWSTLAPHHAKLCEHAGAWASQLKRIGDLAGTLARFCEERLE